MKIFGKGKPNYPPHLEELFKAMESGKRIKSVTCMAGRMGKDDRSRDFTIVNFTAHSYWKGFCVNKEGEAMDYVVVNTTVEKGASFYMDWVLSFEL